MANVHLYNYLSVNIDGEHIELGSLTTPISRALTNDVAYRRVFSVGTETTQELFDVNDVDLSAFDMLWIACDFDLILQLVTDDDADVGEEIFTLGLLGSATANKYGIPFILARDDSYANYTVDFGGGTLDLIERISVRNLSTTQAARCVILALN